MRSFRLYVGHRSRLTAAGWLLLLLSAVTTIALSFAAVTWWVFRLGSRLDPGATAIALYLIAAGGGVATWSAGAARFCRMAGLSLVTPGGHVWDGTLSLPRPVQFTLRQLQSVIFCVAVLCTLARLHSDQFGKVMYLVSMLTVITCGTAGIVCQWGTTSLRSAMVCGGLAGSGLSAVCLGWMFVLSWVIKPGMGPLWVLAWITVLGGLFGVLIGLSAVVWHRWRSGLASSSNR